MSDFKTRPHSVRTPPTPLAAPTANELHRAARHADTTRRQAEEGAKLVARPGRHAHAAGIDVGDATHRGASAVGYS